MAVFTAAGTTSGAALIKQIYMPGWVEGVFKNNALLQHFPAPVDSGGDTACRWKVHGGANGSVEVFAEGQVQPSADSQDFYNAAVNYIAFRAMVQITGHARDAMRSNWVNGLEEEMMLAKEDIMDLITTSYMESTYGLEVAVDSTSAYAGITRGSATYFESQETAVSAPIGYSHMMAMYQGLRDNNVGAKPGLIMCPWNQYSRIYAISGGPTVRAADSNDVAKGYEAITFNGVPIAPMPDMTDTVILFLDMAPEKWAHVVHRNWDVKQMGPSGDSDVYQISYSGILACKDPKKQGKLTACTA
jgi:hypothetical protein